tara:strand:- start:984 stop:1337 length:354 start_codon:yes stop_codon:yes gene_type:complete
MSAGKYDITIDQGSDFKLTLVIKDGDAVRNLDGHFARGHLRASMDTAQHWAFDFTDSSYNSSGTLVMKMANDVVANNGNTALSEGNYFYDVEIYTSGDATVERILQGKAKVTREVTR